MHAWHWRWALRDFGAARTQGWQPIRPSRRRKTSPQAIKPKTAVLTASVEPAEAKPGETVTFKVTAKLDPGFHIYNYSKTRSQGDRSRRRSTSSTRRASRSKATGRPRQEPEKHKDPNFPEIDAVEYHEERSPGAS